MGSLNVFIFLLYFGSGGSVPLMYSPPTLDAPVIINNGYDFSQTCNINYNGSDPDAAFDLSWLFDGIPYKTMTVKNNLLLAALTSADWKGKLGKKLTCSVESYLASKNKSVHSQHLTSNDYFGGLQMNLIENSNRSNPMTLNIYEGDTGTIIIKSTLPIVCTNFSSDRCALDLDVTVTLGNPDYIFFDGGCSLTLLSSKWDTVNHNVESRMAISTLIEPLHKADQHFNITFTIRQDKLGPDLFYSQDPFEIAVETHDRSHSFCMVFGTSDFVGFRPTVSFNIGMYTGDFLMYQGTNKFGKQLQVQIRNWRPVGGASSVCGVAFQYGQTLIKVNMCSSQPNMTAPIITQGHSNPDDVITYLCGSSYEIVTGDDVRLSVVVNIDHLDIKLHLSPAYTNEGQGTCNLTAESFLLQDKDQHGISEDNSLFGKAALPFYKVGGKDNHPAQFCQCGGSSRACSPFHLVADLGSPIAVNGTGIPLVRSGCSVVVPHSLNPDITPMDLISSSGVDPNRISYQFQSFQPCENAIRQHSSSFCLSRNAAKIRFFRDICAKDARFTGDVHDNIPSVVQGFDWYCQEHVLAVNAYYSRVNGELLPPPEVTSDMCSSVCSLHGTCIHGLCACDSGYSGVDCSVKINTPPIIVGIIGGNKCEMSSFHCGQPILITRNILPSINLQVILNATVASNDKDYETVYLEPIYENKYSVSLPMEHAMTSLNLRDKTAVRYTITITSDGKLFSPPFDYLVYDDKCQECGMIDGCYIKENSCHINGACYILNDANPNNASQMCDPDKALLHWTDAQGQSASGTIGSGSVSVPLTVK